MPQPDKLSLYQSGIGHYTRQDFAAARADFERALTLDPDLGDAHQALAHVHERLGDYVAALAAARRAVECNPTDPLAYTTLSICCQRQGMIPEAEAAKARAAQLQAGSA
ncbi:MAG: tetratricopeptide repeat protein [Gemmatimonadota bacterium]